MNFQTKFLRKSSKYVPDKVLKISDTKNVISFPNEIVVNCDVSINCDFITIFYLFIL